MRTTKIDEIYTETQILKHFTSISNLYSNAKSAVFPLYIQGFRCNYEYHHQTRRLSYFKCITIYFDTLILQNYSLKLHVKDYMRVMRVQLILVIGSVSTSGVSSVTLELPSSLCEICLMDVEIFAVSISRNCSVSIVSLYV